jgi:RNA polymerase sigma-70 factor (ECF subfamily)
MNSCVAHSKAGERRAEPGMDASVERKLLTSARNGDQAAFVRLVEQYRHLVLSLAYQMTGSAADMDDLAQETFMRAYRNLSTFRGEASFKTWLVKIVMNLSNNYRRSRKTAAETESAEAFVLASPAEGQDLQMLSCELRAQVRRAVAELPAHYRSVVVLRDFQSLRYEEIAGALGIPIGTVMSRLAKARGLLRAGLAPYLGRSENTKENAATNSTNYHEFI